MPIPGSPRSAILVVSCPGVGITVFRSSCAVLVLYKYPKNKGYKGARARLDRPYGTFDIEPDSELWKNTKKGKGLMKDFSAYILESRINFPVGMGGFPFTRQANLVS